MRPRAVFLALLIVVALLAPVAGGATAPDAAPAPALTQQSEPDTPETTMRVSLRPDGDARWNVTMFFSVSNDTAFAEVARAFENGSADVGPSVETFDALAARGADAAGRGMTIADIERRGWRPNENTGALTLTFTWTNFAAVSGERVVVGDAFGGEWDIAAGQRLVFYPPEGYLLQGFQPGTDRGVSDGVVRWGGPRTFTEGEPRIEYSAAGNGPTNTTPGEEPEGIGATTLGGLLVLALIVAGGGYLFATRKGSSDGEAASAESAGESPSGVGTTPSAEETEPAPESEPEDGAGEADSAAGAAGAAAGASEPVDESLLSDEERVERLLERNGGRMKQANIVEETGWSNAKVSQLLSAMADEGRVEKLRIGRENLISLPDEGGESE